MNYILPMLSPLPFRLPALSRRRSGKGEGRGRGVPLCSLCPGPMNMNAQMPRSSLQTLDVRRWAFDVLIHRPGPLSLSPIRETRVIRRSNQRDPNPSEPVRTQENCFPAQKLGQLGQEMVK